MIECVCCGKNSNSGFTTVKDARIEVGEIWFCHDCFNLYFNGDYMSFRSLPELEVFEEVNDCFMQMKLPLTFS